ncbi:MAG TPA: 3-oxoadipate enol-lactonase [Steroidobacteraceae bacterium]|nr:3-oxoadipate enol-lactonase [Steroidobacteraceae bacterium]
MAWVRSGSVEIRYEVQGAAEAPALLLLHSLGVDLGMWDAQVRDFLQHYRIIRYDVRGHGQSTVGPAECSMEILAQDALAVLDAAQVARAHWCGLSLGGMTAMWAASHRPERVARLVLCNTSAHLPPPALWHSRIDLVRREGMRAVAPAVIERWFTADFRRSQPEQVARIEAMLEATPPEGYAAACAAIAAMNQLSEVRRIAAPTLVICGAEDPATPLEHSAALCAAIADSRLVVLPAAHLSNVERPQEFSAAVGDFLSAPASLP